MKQTETSFEAERQAFFGQGFGFGKFVIMTSNPNPKPQKKSCPPQTQNLAKKTRLKRIKISLNRESLSLKIKLNKFREKTLNLEKHLEELKQKPDKQSETELGSGYDDIA